MIAASRLVLDASVVVKWYVPERGTPEAIAIRDTIPFLAAPDLLTTELGNAVWKKLQRGEISRTDADAIIQAFVVSRQVALYSARPLLEPAFAAAADIQHPIYDALYLALAEILGCPLVTDDQRLIRAVAGTRFAPMVKSLAGHREGVDQSRTQDL